jgi:hypothetical protein
MLWQDVLFLMSSRFGPKYYRPLAISTNFQNIGLLIFTWRKAFCSSTIVETTLDVQTIIEWGRKMLQGTIEIWRLDYIERDICNKMYLCACFYVNQLCRLRKTFDRVLLNVYKSSIFSTVCLLVSEEKTRLFMKMNIFQRNLKRNFF